jgi:hypothetical protein
MRNRSNASARPEAGVAESGNLTFKYQQADGSDVSHCHEGDARRLGGESGQKVQIAGCRFSDMSSVASRRPSRSTMAAK